MICRMNLSMYLWIPHCRENKLDFEKTSLPEVKGWRFKVGDFLSMKNTSKNHLILIKQDMY